MASRGPAPDRVRTVVLGGGPAGHALAAALAAGGDDEVVVLDRRATRADRDVPTERFGAVLVGHASPDLVALAGRSVRALADLADGDAAIWRATGSVEVATTPERVAVLRRRAEILGAAGLAAEPVDADRVAGLVPGLDPRTILGGLHVPGDGVADRAAVGAALARRASAAGVVTRAGVRVTEVRVEDGRVVGVGTDAGAIACERLVLASCTESVRVAALAGVVLPLVSVPRPIRLSGDVAGGPIGAFPVVRHPDAALAIRERGVGFALAGHGDPAAWAAAAARLLPSHADAFASPSGPPAEEATVVATPDGHPIAGAHAALRGLWVLTGARLAWIPAAADALADRMLDRPSTVRLGSSDPNRWYPFEEAAATATPRSAAIAAAAHDPAPPDPDALPPRDLRRSPIHRRLAAVGARWTGVAGWEVAVDLGDPEAEVRAARAGVAIADRTPLAKFDVEGPGAAAFLAEALGAAVDVPVGSLRGLPARSDIDLPDLTVARKGPALFRVVVGARVGPRVLGFLRSRAGGDPAVRVVERTGSLFAITLLGPRAADVVAAASGVDTSEAAFPPGTARYLALGPVTPVWAQRSPGAPLSAWDLFGQIAMGERAWELLLEAGADAGVAPVGAAALRALGVADR